MAAVNALFSAFADKTLAFEFNHIVKLVTFSSSEDNESTTNPNLVANLLRKNRVTVDSFVVGSKC